MIMRKLSPEEVITLECRLFSGRQASTEFLSREDLFEPSKRSRSDFFRLKWPDVVAKSRRLENLQEHKT